MSKRQPHKRRFGRRAWEGSKMREALYNHAEAHCILWYNCEDCDHEFKTWNSRDGVTPFTCLCPECWGDAIHKDWGKDEFCPDYMPEPGDLIWIDMPDSLKTVLARVRIESFKGTDFEVPEERYGEVFMGMVDSIQPGTPWLITWPGKAKEDEDDPTDDE